jgi:hypothetical protein
MNRLSLVTTAGATVCLLAGTGCNRGAAGPDVQTTTTTAQAKADPVTTSGCLRAGLAENTFVLTTPASDPGGQAATYQLSGHDVNLREYVGQQVQVSGTVRAEEQVASTAADVTEKKAKGTSGTPTVETKTELDVKQMTVSSVTPSGQRCAPEPPKEDQQSPRRIK